MTWVNIRCPANSDIRAEQYRDSQRAELEFWKKKAEELQVELENAFDHAKEYGKIELHHRGEKICLVVASHDRTPSYD